MSRCCLHHALFLLLLCTCTFDALQTWGPGYALSINTRTNYEFAYTYPRRLGYEFTIEFWAHGGSPIPNYTNYFSVAHPKDDNTIIIADYLYVLGMQIMKLPSCPSVTWCHQALTVNVSAYPSYAIAFYLNGVAIGMHNDTFTKGSPATNFDEEKLSITFGGEQDGVLDGWDTSQSFSGHIDEVRVWNYVRSSQQVASNFQVALSKPYPPGLVMYYPFDSDSLNATYFEDLTSLQPKHRMYVANYKVPSQSPSLTPTYEPPSHGIAALTISTAPICSANGWGQKRIQPGGFLTLDVTSLYCNATGNTVVTVFSVQGVLIQQGGQDMQGRPLDASKPLTLLTVDARSSAWAAEFNYTVQDMSTTETVYGRVQLFPNHAPVVASKAFLQGEEDVELSAWIQVDDPDNDVVHLQLVRPPLPGQGTATVDNSIRRSITYVGESNQFGVNISSFWVRARDRWGAMSNLMMVSVSLKAVQDVPTLDMQLEYTIYRGQRLRIPFNVTDVDGEEPFVIVSDWPTPEQGTLLATEGKRQWTIDQCSVSSKLQWASGVQNFSTDYSGFGGQDYSAQQIIGKPQSLTFGDSRHSWCPSTIDGNCTNRASPSQAIDHFYTEFLEPTFQMPMFLTDVIIFENYGGDRVSRILVPSNEDSQKWKVIFHRYLPDLPPVDQTQKYSVFSPDICNVVWPVNKLRIEIDTCHRSGWYEVDAVQVRGGVLPPTNILNHMAELAFIASADFIGNVSFGLTATSCYGSFPATSEPQNIVVQVLEPPYVLHVIAREDWVPIDVTASFATSNASSLQLLQLPFRGALRYRGHIPNSTHVELGAESTIFEYLPYRCDSQDRDSFLVQIGPAVVVSVLVDGCQQSSIVILAVAIPVAASIFLAGGAFAFWRKRPAGRDNSYAPINPDRPICVLFTDIQASTLLWGEVPELMSRALDVHHLLVRRLIKRYKCYEVKTIGDSFMVVTADTCAAVQLALGIQHALYEHEWVDDGIDVIYRRVSGCRLPLAEYRKLWRGLRLRVGIHFGNAQITFDEVSKGYDYYGTVVNAAARIQAVAHGGQIVVSSDVYEQIWHRSGNLSCSVSSKPLGAHQLQGLPGPIELMEVLPIQFAGRNFPPLRMAWTANDEDECEDQVTDMASSVRDHGSGAVGYPEAMEKEVVHHALVRHGAMTVEAAISLAYNAFYTIKALLCMSIGEARRKKLKEFCKKWHVPYQAADEEQELRTVGKLTLQIMGSVATQSNSRQRRLSRVSTKLTEEEEPHNVVVMRPPFARMLRVQQPSRDILTGL